MGKGIRYLAEFKQEFISQANNHGYSVAEVANRLGISSNTLYGRTKRLASPSPK